MRNRIHLAAMCLKGAGALALGLSLDPKVLAAAPPATA